MICLFHVNLPCQYMGDEHHPSLTRGTPLIAPKQERYALNNSFPLFILLEGSMHPSHSKIAYISVFLCQVNLPCQLMGDVHHPSVTGKDPLKAPKQAEICPK